MFIGVTLVSCETDECNEIYVESKIERVDNNSVKNQIDLIRNSIDKELYLANIQNRDTNL